MVLLLKMELNLRILPYCMLFTFSLLVVSVKGSNLELHYYYDANSQEDFYSVQSKPFDRVEKKIDKGLNSGTYWVKVITDNSHPYVVIDSERHRSALCYDMDGNQIPVVEGTVLTSFFVGYESTAMLKVYSDKGAHIPILAHTESCFRLMPSQQLFIQGLYYGFSLLVIILNLYLFFNLRDKSFLFYALFVLSISLSLGYSDGLIHLFIDNWPTYKNWELIFHFGAGLFGSLFAGYYLQHHIHLPRLKYGTALLLFLALLSYTLFVFTENIWLFAIGEVVIISILFIYWLSGIYLIGKNKFSLIFAIAYSLSVLLAFDFYILPLFGWPNLGINTNFIKVGGVFEILTLSFAVVYRMRILQNKNEAMKESIFEHVSHIEEMEEELKKLSSGEINTITEADLSQREIEILTYITQGKTYQEMADTLHLSINTIKYHTKKLYDKLNVSSRQEAKQIAAELNVSV